jgi:hypothetical protein
MPEFALGTRASSWTMSGASRSSEAVTSSVCAL